MDIRSQVFTGCVSIGLALGALFCLFFCILAVRTMGGSSSWEPLGPLSGERTGTLFVWCGFVGLPLLGLSALVAGVFARRTWQGHTAVALSLMMGLIVLDLFLHR